MIPFTKSQFSGGRKGVSYDLYTERRFFWNRNDFSDRYVPDDVWFQWHSREEYFTMSGFSFYGRLGGGGGGLWSCFKYNFVSKDS